VGVHHDPVALDLVNLCYNNWRIIGCGSAPIEVAMIDILEMMRSERYDLLSLVTREFKVDQITDALFMARVAGEAQKVCISFLMEAATFTDRRPGHWSWPQSIVSREDRIWFWIKFSRLPTSPAI
jgi:hypothetical protein